MRDARCRCARGDGASGADRFTRRHTAGNRTGPIAIWARVTCHTVELAHSDAMRCSALAYAVCPCAGGDHSGRSLISVHGRGMEGGRGPRGSPRAASCDATGSDECGGCAECSRRGSARGDRGSRSVRRGCVRACDQPGGGGCVSVGAGRPRRDERPSIRDAESAKLSKARSLVDVVGGCHGALGASMMA